eukprot:s1514_g10.t1
MADASPAKSAGKPETEEAGPEVETPAGDHPPATPLKKPAAKSAAKSAAKGKAKAKASPKVEPKASGAMKVLKKPASAKPKAVLKTVLKKPASAKAASKGGSSWSVGTKGLEAMQIEEEKDQEEQAEEEMAEEDEVMEPEDKFQVDEKTKDRSKDFKFKTLLAQGCLPGWLKTAYTKTLNMKQGRVAEQRRLVNLALDRKPDGALETFEVTKASKKEKALPRFLFQGKFNLTDEKFEQGLQEGQFFLVKDEQGREKYSWDQLEHSHESGSSSKLSLGASKALSVNENKVEKAAFSTWSKGLFGQVNPKSLPATPQLMPLQDKENALTEAQWQAAQSQLIEATQAFEKMPKEVKKHLQETVKGENLTVENYDEVMGVAGSAASRIQQALAGIRGQLQARAARARKQDDAAK